MALRASAPTTVVSLCWDRQVRGSRKKFTPGTGPWQSPSLRPWPHQLPARARVSWARGPSCASMRAVPTPHPVVVLHKLADHRLQRLRHEPRRTASMGRGFHRARFASTPQEAVDGSTADPAPSRPSRTRPAPSTSCSSPRAARTWASPSPGSHPAASSSISVTPRERRMGGGATCTTGVRRSGKTLRNPVWPHALACTPSLRAAAPGPSCDDRGAGLR